MSVIKIESIRRPISEGQAGTVTGRNADNQIVRVQVASKDWPTFDRARIGVGERVRYNADTREWVRT